jgi:hypothetical membrane protein
MTVAGKPQQVGGFRAQPKELPSNRIAFCVAVSGVVGPLLFIGVFTVMGALRPGYSALHQAVSDLGVGPNSWIVNGSGLVCAALMIASVTESFRALRGYVAGLLRCTSAILLVLPPIGLAVACVFTEARATVRLHWLIGGTLLFRGPVVAFLFTALALRGSSRLQAWSTSALVAGLGNIPMWTAFSRKSPIASAHLLGLTERIVVTWILGWYVIGSLQLARGAIRDLRQPVGGTY